MIWYATTYFDHSCVKSLYEWSLFMTVEINLDNNSNVLHHMIILHVSWDHGKQLCCRHVANIADTGPGTHCWNGGNMCVWQSPFSASVTRRNAEKSISSNSRDRHTDSEIRNSDKLSCLPLPQVTGWVCQGAWLVVRRAVMISVLSSPASVQIVRLPVVQIPGEWDWFFIQARCKTRFLWRNNNSFPPCLILYYFRILTWK